MKLKNGRWLNEVFMIGPNYKYVPHDDWVFIMVEHVQFIGLGEPWTGDHLEKNVIIFQGVNMILISGSIPSACTYKVLIVTKNPFFIVTKSLSREKRRSNFTIILFWREKSWLLKKCTNKRHLTYAYENYCKNLAFSIKII